MRSSIIFLLAFLAAAVSAHFQVQFPPPRGPFDSQKEVLFCDGYTTPAAVRTEFPLIGGYVTLKFSHGDNWIAGILVSTSQNATRFEDFVLHNGYEANTKPGSYCLPLDFSKSNVTGLSDGQNITIQVVWNGGDGNLYQCADLRLANNATITTACQNVSTTPTHSTSPGTATQTTSPATANSAKQIMSLTALTALAGLLFL